MRKLLLPLLFLCATLTVRGQNLVFNGNFESYAICPTTVGQATNCTGWRPFTAATPDYYNACTAIQVGVPINLMGYQPAASGNGYLGSFAFDSPPTVTTTTYKEPIAGTIIPMQIGFIYEVSLSVSLSNKSRYGTDDIGVYFYKDGPSAYSTTYIPPVTPQVTYSSYGPITDTVNWVRLAANFYADSAYNNIVIGSWQQAALANKLLVSAINQGSYYFFDSVVVRRTKGIIINYSDSLLCAGQTVSVPYAIVSSSYIHSSNIFTLQLSDGTGNFASATTLATQAGTTAGSFTFNVPNVPAGTGYRLRVISSNTADTSNVNLKPISIGNIAIIKPVITSGAVCLGQTLNLYASTNTGINYHWTGPSSFTSTMQNPTISSVTNAASGNYTVTGWSYGCSSRDTETITVNPIPATPVASSNTPVCSGTVLNLTSGGSLPGATYNWTGPNAFISNQQNPIITNANTGMAGTYNVSATLNGCTSATASTSVTILYLPSTVNIYPLPNDTICVGGTIQFVAVASNGGANPQYKWMKNGSIISSATAISYTASNMITGDKFRAVLTPDNTCPDPDTSAEIEVAVLPYVTPSVAITASPGTLISPWQTITFTAVPVNGGKSPAYQWKRNGQNINGAINDTWGAYTLSNNDTISVEMFSSEYCPSPASASSNKIIVAVKTGVDDVKNEDGLVLYPNPNNGNFTLKANLLSQQAEIEVWNKIGQVVYRDVLKTKNGVLDANISLNEALATGVYLLKIKSTNENIVLRFTVDK